MVNRLLNETKPIAFYVPENLSPKIFEQPHQKYVAYFLNLLHWKWICWKGDENGNIRLKQSYITKVIPPEIWKIILDVMVGKAIIHHSNFWIPGINSQGYCLAPNYRKARRVNCTNDIFNRKIHRVYSKDNNLQPIHKWLEENLNLLEFDFDRATRIISTLSPKRQAKKKEMTVEEYRTPLGD